MPSLAELLKIPSKDETIDVFVGLLRLAGFPVASWHSGAFKRHTVETEASMLVDVHTSVQKIAKAGYIKLAAEIDDAWVDLGAENVFSETRKPAVFTQGKIRLTDTQSTGPHTIALGAHRVADVSKSIRFTNVEAGVIPLGGSVDLTFQAETAGTKWNVGVGAIVEYLTPLPGVTVSNPAQPSGTWITQQGANKESNAALVQRCLDKWSIIGSGSNDGAYRYHAASASSEITRVKVYSPGGGSVRVIVAGDAGPVSSTALNAAATIIEQKRPLGVPDVVTSNALSVIKLISGTLYVSAGFDLTATLSAALASLDAFQRATPLGSTKVSREKIIKALVVDGVDDLTLNEPLDDFTLNLGEVWIPSYALVPAATV